jgi:hypothetical protein
VAFESANSEGLTQTVSIHKTEAAAKAAMTSLRKLVEACAKFSYRYEGTTVKATYGLMSLTPTVKPAEHFSWRWGATYGGVTASAMVTAYRTATTTGVVMLSGFFVDNDEFKGYLATAIDKA